VIRVLIADDQALVRGGFRVILDSEPDIEVIGEAEDGEQATTLAASLAPDVVLMDIRMPGTDGIEATRRLLETEKPPHVLILTTFDHDEFLYDAIHAGASGFLLKNVSPSHLAHAVRTVASGDALLDPTLTRKLLDEFSKRPAPGARAPDRLDELTDRELDVLRLLARGLSNTEIAHALFLSAATIKTHVSNILAKLHLHDRVQAVVLAYETGLIKPGEFEPPQSSPDSRV
jgi:DNA-binding NarL/FixJ family response regulator